MAPELQILLVIAAILAAAYLFVYPAQLHRARPIRAIAIADVLITILTHGLTGLRFAGTGTRFDLLLFETNWFVYTLLLYMMLEVPLAWRFFTRNGLDPWKDD